jgi:hypothetical protein
MVVLGLLIFFAMVINKLLPDGGFWITLKEIFIIVGWVALWRPAEYLLYEWRPYKRETELLGRLEKCKVEIVPES